MTIPYPKREFLNDDDSDSKSSAAKVIKIMALLQYWINLCFELERLPKWRDCSTVLQEVRRQKLQFIDKALA